MQSTQLIMDVTEPNLMPEMNSMTKGHIRIKIQNQPNINSVYINN